jgi:hypothetical protein
LSASVPSHHNLSSAAFITVIAESDFRYTQISSNLFLSKDSAKLKQAILYIERNPEIVKSITSFRYIAKSL